MLLRSMVTISSSLQNSQSWSCGSVGQFMALLYKPQGGSGWFPGGCYRPPGTSAQDEPRTEVAQTPTSCSAPLERAGPMPGLALGRGVP